MKRSEFLARPFGRLLSLVAGAVLALNAHAATELLVYTAIEADELAMFKTEFEQDHPDIDIKWVRDSTGIVTRQAAGGEGQSESRHRLGAGCHQPRPARQ